MLTKLIKHEFRATGQIMLPLYLVVLLTAVGANNATRWMFDSSLYIFRLMGTLLMFGFSFAIFGVFIESFALMVQRFYKNLLQDEGYVMLTLPVSIHQHICTKMFVSAVWFILSAVVVCIASGIVVANVDFLRDILEGTWDLLLALQKTEAYYTINGATIMTEFGLLCFLGLFAMCIQFYAALAVGHSMPNHKMAFSVIAFFVMLFASQMIVGSLLIGLDQVQFFGFLASFQLKGMAAIHAGMLMMCSMVVIYGAAFYAITVYFLKRRLNLE